jgi:hypothetical protein
VLIWSVPLYLLSIEPKYVDILLTLRKKYTLCRIINLPALIVALYQQIYRKFVIWLVNKSNWSIKRWMEYSAIKQLFNRKKQWVLSTWTNPFSKVTLTLKTGIMDRQLLVTIGYIYLKELLYIIWPTALWTLPLLKMISKSVLIVLREVFLI